MKQITRIMCDFNKEIKSFHLFNFVHVQPIEKEKKSIAYELKQSLEIGVRVDLGFRSGFSCTGNFVGLVSSPGLSSRPQHQVGK